MNQKIVIAAIALGASALAPGQKTQAISAAITLDQATNYLSAYASISPSSTTSQPKVLDIRSSYGCGGWLNASAPYQTTAVHDYEGYVRVKWILETPPETDEDYEATFDVWSIRAGMANVAFIKTSPGYREAAVHSTVLNFFLASLNMDAAASSPGNDTDSGGDVSLGSVFSQSLPTSHSSSPWDYRGNYVSVARFSWQTDGYYANVPIIGVTAYAEADSKYSSTGFWNAIDQAQSAYEARIIYKIVSVAGDSVN